MRIYPTPTTSCVESASASIDFGSRTPPKVGQNGGDGDGGGGGGGGVSAIIAEGLDPKLDVMEYVGTYLIKQKDNTNNIRQIPTTAPTNPLNAKFEKQSIPQAVLTIADYSYKSAFVADQEVNMVACLTEIMMDSEFV